MPLFIQNATFSNPHGDADKMLDAERRRIGVRVYDDETRALAVEAVGAGFTMREAAELAGCSRRAVSDWCRAAGVEPARKKPVYLPYEEKMELVARYEAGERAADLAAEAGVTGPAVTGWARRLREEGALSLMTEGDVRARVPEPAEPPSELEALRRRCEELELENAILAGTVEILKKDPGADPSALTAAERAALAESLRAEFGLPRVLAALSLARSTYYHRRSRAAADPDAALRPLVLEEFEASGGRYGYRRVHAALRARGVRASEKRVRRVMRGEGLEAARPRRRRYSSYAGEEGLRDAPNLLLVDEARDLHDFSAPSPGEALVTDVTEFRC